MESIESIKGFSGRRASKLGKASARRSGGTVKAVLVVWLHYIGLHV